MARLVYSPPKRSDTIARRVYALPRELVGRIHAYGYESGHQSETAAVRELLQRALDEHECRRNAKGEA